MLTIHIIQGDICPDKKLATVSKLFIVLLVLAGLGFFCGPMLEMTSSWTTYVPGGLFTLASISIGVGVTLFSNLEGIPNSDAIYASFIVGASTKLLSLFSLRLPNERTTGSFNNYRSTQEPQLGKYGSGRLFLMWTVQRY